MFTKENTLKITAEKDKKENIIKPNQLAKYMHIAKPNQPMHIAKQTQVKPSPFQPKPFKKIPYLTADFKHPHEIVNFYELAKLKEISTDRVNAVNAKGLEILEKLVKPEQTHRKYMQVARERKMTPSYIFAKNFVKKAYPYLSNKYKFVKNRLLYELNIINKSSGATEWKLFEPKTIENCLKRNGLRVNTFYDKLLKKKINREISNETDEKRLKNHEEYLNKAKKWFNASVQRIQQNKFTLSQAQHIRARMLSVYFFPEFLKSRQAHFHLKRYVRYYVKPLVILLKKRKYVKALKYIKKTFLPYKINNFIVMYNKIVLYLNTQIKLKCLNKKLSKKRKLYYVKARNVNEFHNKLLKYCYSLKYVFAANEEDLDWYSLFDIEINND